MIRRLIKSVLHFVTQLFQSLKKIIYHTKGKYVLGKYKNIYLVTINKVDDLWRKILYSLLLHISISFWIYMTYLDIYQQTQQLWTLTTYITYQVEYPIFSFLCQKYYFIFTFLLHIWQNYVSILILLHYSKKLYQFRQYWKL